MLALFNSQSGLASYYGILFLYTVLMVGSSGILLGWSPAVRRLWLSHRDEFRELEGQEIAAGMATSYGRLIHNVPALGTCYALRWCKPFQIAVSVVEHALFIAALAALRCAQLVESGASIIGSGDILLALILLGMADSKRRINRAGAIRPNRSMRWTWYAFNGSVVAAALSVGTLAILAELGYRHVAP